MPTLQSRVSFRTVRHICIACTADTQTKAKEPDYRDQAEKLTTDKPILGLLEENRISIILADDNQI